MCDQETECFQEHHFDEQPAWVGANISPCNVVLEGGAMRGQFTAGVTDYWMEQGFFPQNIIGTSAGALVGVYYAAGQIGRCCFLNVKYAQDWHYLSLKSFARTGNVYGRQFVFDDIPNKLDPFDAQAYNLSPVKLTAVSSNLETGEADYHVMEDFKEDLPYLIASSSLPLLSQIVEVDGKKLLDGGNCDSVALTYSQLTGVKKHVVVLTRDASYVKQPNKLMSLIRTRYAAYPYFCDRIEHRFFEYNRLYRRLQRMHEAKEIFVIQPAKPVEVESLEKDTDKLMDLYEQGYEQAMLTWKDLQAYLERP